jgi:predicted SnoaL-like aldol condensation-catalyzing enzyme
MQKITQLHYYHDYSTICARFCYSSGERFRSSCPVPIIVVVPPRFLRPDYIQHNPKVPTGLKGFMDTFRKDFAQKLPPDYKRELLNVIGDNDMVVVYVRHTWTGRDGQHHQVLGFDMFRVQDGVIAEHWDAD